MNDDVDLDLTDAEFAKFRRRSSHQALTTLLSIMRDKKAAPTARVQAARGVLSDAVAHRNDEVDGRRVSDMSQAELLEAIRATQARLAAITARSSAEDAEIVAAAGEGPDVFA